MFTTINEFMLVLLITMPSGQVEEFIIDSQISTVEECQSLGQQYTAPAIDWVCEAQTITVP